MMTFTISLDPYLDDSNSDDLLIDCTVTPALTAERPYDVVISLDVFTELRNSRDVVCTGADDYPIRHRPSHS